MIAISSFLTIDSVVCGYHVYLALWKPCVEEGFVAPYESGTPHDSHAMAVYRDEDPGVIVGHLIAMGAFKTMPLLHQARASLSACSLLPLACSDVILVPPLGLAPGRDGRCGTSTGLYRMKQVGKCCGSAVDGCLVK